MRQLILSLLLVFSVLVPFVGVQENAEAAGCWGSITGFYQSGYNHYAFGSGTCSGWAGTVQICITSRGGTGCSNVVSVPNGGTRNVETARNVGVCLVGGGTQYATAKLYISGSLYASRSLQRC